MHPIKRCIFPTTCYYILDLVLGKEVWNLARSEHVVDQDEELFVRHLGVGHQEHDAEILQSRLVVQGGELRLHIGDPITLLQLDLEHLQRAYERGQSR